LTPYGWFTGINGNVTARGHTVDVDESFIEIAEHADSFAALMGYFEARKGRWRFFTDAVWADLGFPGHLNYDINRSASGNPFARLPDFKGTIKQAEDQRQGSSRLSGSDRPIRHFL
jgi:hypothetical protein